MPPKPSHLNKSFSHSVARYRRRRVRRAFAGGITSSFTSWKIFQIRLGQFWGWLLASLRSNPTPTQIQRSKPPRDYPGKPLNVTRRRLDDNRSRRPR